MQITSNMVSERPGKRVRPDSSAAAILIVEEEFLVALDERVRLSSIGFSNVGIVTTDEDFIDEVRQRQPELVLVNADRVSHELVEAIWAECRCAFVFVGGHSARRAGITNADHFLLRPFSTAALLRAVESTLGASSRPV
jgi:AmiR/NasT family two-component response regulator